MNSTPYENENRAGANAPEFSVSELSGAIKRSLEESFGYVRLRGEISGYRGPHSSGHCYFALKDDKAKIEAVIWRGSFGRLRFKPEEGMEVVVRGRITTFPGSSKYQIVIDALEPAGAGALMALLDERKRKFAAEGLFDESRKKERPFLPKVVGIVTSPTGAVIRDMLHGFHERFPTCVLLWPVRVQGEGAAAEIAAAIRGFNAFEPGGAIARPDVLIVGRGGGSLEDLWCFNEEIVVRAAAESRIPLISAVGHETDWTLLDLVADARAPTPTKAAEWAVPKYSELVDTLTKLQLRHRTAVRRALEAVRTHLKAASRGLPKLDNLIAPQRQRFDEYDRRLTRGLLANARAHATRLARTAGRLTPSPLAQKLAHLGERLVTLENRADRALLNCVAVRRGELDGRAAMLRSLLDSLVAPQRQRFDDYDRRLARGLLANARAHATRLARTSGRLTPSPLAQKLAHLGERLGTLENRADRALLNCVAVRRRVLDGRASLLRSLGYQSILSRGFALVRDDAGRMVRLARSVSPGARLSIEFPDGRVGAVADGGPSPGTRELEDGAPKTPRRKPRGRGGQGSLF